MHRSTRNFNIPPPGQATGIWTFEDQIVQIPAPSGQNSVQMPYPVVGFVCLSVSPTYEDLFCKPIAHNCYISSFKLLHLVQTCVLWPLATSASEIKIIWNLTLPVQFWPLPAWSGEIPHSPGTEDRQMPGVCPGGGGGGEMLKFWYDRRISRLVSFFLRNFHY